jgi:hypothetical protein
MLRITLLALGALLSVGAHAASLKEQKLTDHLQQVARESSVGTPRAINEDILDRGFTVEGHELVNHLSVLPRHAEQMRANPDTVRAQLGASVCRNAGFHELLVEGATLRYQFNEYQNDRPVTTQRFTKADCGIK